MRAARNRNRRRNRAYGGRYYDNRPVYYQPSYAPAYRTRSSYSPYRTSGYRSYNTYQSGSNCNTGYSRYSPQRGGRFQNKHSSHRFGNRR